MPAARASAFLKFRHIILLASAFSVSQLPAPASAAGLVSANLLEGYERPLSVVVDMMDDSSESQSIARNIKQALIKQGIAVVDDGEMVLEVNINASANTTGIDRSLHAEAENRDVARQNDPLTTLSPNRELSPNMPDSKKRRPGQNGASIDMDMTLYKRGKPPIWSANGTASRDFRNLAEQGSAMAVKALTLLGKSGTLNLD
ncbi:hypothetical protein [Govanella unica]|uniref:Uncharacterized protein n=1 Tax=Govanella unica TaxID=2975056 RepID=A0A9X3Z7G9_9PROT|nr:hypothetical protein [Govania unica]MDA5193969.1 hypothetical protein [Govania unica]